MGVVAGSLCLFGVSLVPLSVAVDGISTIARGVRLDVRYEDGS